MSHPESTFVPRSTGPHLRAHAAFTLIELLVVISIITIIAAVLFPIINSSKGRAKEATAMSNLRQCAQALTLYAVEGPEAMPTYSSAKETLAKAPTCDPSDYITPNCSPNFGEPLIGSFAYIRGVADFKLHSDWLARVREDRPLFLMASVYYGDKRYVPWNGDELNPCISDNTCMLPNKILRVRDDTSVQVWKREVRRNGTGQLFSWAGVFSGK